MPTVFSFFGLRFLFFSNDHEPIHVHVVKGKGAVKEFAIFQVVPDINLIENNGLNKQELRLAEMIIEENSDTIQERWNVFFGK
ncbi:MAG: DUF4160 domain-containing protein [Prevotellaceae bacterium]|jgi:hypothetical protein|nr:DUF4160 domain-containing protein [Prevotellaceae bacterium]